MGNKTAVVIGIGSIEIPSMVFADFDSGVKYVSSVLGEPTAQRTRKENRSAVWNNFPNFDEHQELAKKFFTRYYGGCGECEQIIVTEVDFGVPIVGFSLD